MALSNSERQRQYRQRRLGLGGRYERITCLVSIATKRSIERLAFYYGRSITEMIEKLINDKTVDVMSSLDDDGKDQFFEQREVSEKA